MEENQEKQSIIIVDRAIDALKKELTARSAETTNVRLGVKGGSCAGFSYVIQYGVEPKDDDLLLPLEGLTICIDPKSLKLLGGMTLDYQSSLMRQEFVFSNPNARSKCGCGSSFGV